MDTVHTTLTYVDQWGYRRQECIYTEWFQIAQHMAWVREIDIAERNDKISNIVLSHS